MPEMDVFIEMKTVNLSKKKMHIVYVNIEMEKCIFQKPVRKDQANKQLYNSSTMLDIYIMVMVKSEVCRTQKCYFIDHSYEFMV